MNILNTDIDDILERDPQQQNNYDSNPIEDTTERIMDSALLTLSPDQKNAKDLATLVLTEE